jgi:hypothetical protein
VRFPPVKNETEPETSGENPAGAELSAELKRVQKNKKVALIKKYEAKLLEQKQVWNPNATKLNTGDRVRLDKIVDSKLKLEMAKYRAEMDGFAPSGDDLLTSTPQGPPPPPTPVPVDQLGATLDRTEIASASEMANVAVKRLGSAQYSQVSDSEMANLEAFDGNTQQLNGRKQYLLNER